MSPIDTVFTGIEQWKMMHLDLVDSGKISIIHGTQDVIWNCQTTYTNYKIRMIYKPAPEIAPVMIDRVIGSDEIVELNLPVLYVTLFLDDMFEALCSRKEGIMPTEMNDNAKVDNDKFLKTAKAAIVCWYNRHNAPSVITMDDVYIVWFSKTLQNWKALASTSHEDGMYYEITYDGNKEVAFVDAYKKWDNAVMTSKLLEIVANKK